jgi:nucleoside-diphosphate-sugar epimerase
MDSPAPLQTPVLVLGATSLIGRFVPPRLEGVDHVALSRTPPPGAAGRWIAADLGDRDLAGRLPSCPTVLSLSPIWVLPQALPALKAAGMRRLVAFSSTSVFTKPNSSHPHERDTARRLAQGEQQTRQFCEREGVAWTLLRPTLIYAEGQDQNVSRLASLARRFGVLPLAGKGEGLRQPVHADDLAAAAITAAATPTTHDRAYDLPGGETLTYRRMSERVFEGLGRRPRILPVPPWAWTVALTLASPVMPGATAAMGTRMSQDLVFDAGPAQRDFGWAPRGFRPRFADL